ncbi:TIR domain-containing protein [Bradyrhizobium sp. USDA 4451]
MLRDANFSHMVGTGHRVFLIMPFALTPTYKILADTIRDVLDRYGIATVRADDRQSAATLWESLQKDMDSCSHAIAIVDDRTKSGINKNVLIETGYMLARKAGVLLLKDRTLASLPTDLLGHLYRTFDPKNVKKTTTKAVVEWLRDQGLAKRPSEKLVVFVSHGGTCRCAMSKAILLNAFKGRTLPFDLSVMSLAAIFGERQGASKSARSIVSKAFGEDILENHRVRKRYPALADEADLILCASADYKQYFPESKTHTIGEYFGKPGNIQNPWPDQDDEISSRKYKDCFEQLRALIEPNSERILRDLQGMALSSHVPLKRAKKRALA